MESFLDDRFVVFLCHIANRSNRPDDAERVLATCSSYEEARQIQRHLQHQDHKCVIRYVGPAGGGD